MSRHRRFIFVVNNYPENIFEILDKVKCSYIIASKEVGKKKKTPHIQGYIEFPNAKSLSAAQKTIPKSHFEIAWGNAEQNFNYCSKENPPIIEKGTPKKQGQRTDLEEMCEDIRDGKTTVSQILESDPYMYHQYGRTLEKTEDEVNLTKHRTEAPECIWYYGATGTGKSYRAYEGYLDNPADFYNKPDDGDWWDGYRGQNTVIIDEFRGNIKFSRLLTLCHQYPTEVRRRGRQPMPFTSKKVIVTSCHPPERIYCNLSENDSIEQLYRRFTVYEVTHEGITQKCPEGNRDLCADSEIEYYT